MGRTIEEAADSNTSRNWLRRLADHLCNRLTSGEYAEIPHCKELAALLTKKKKTFLEHDAASTYSGRGNFRGDSRYGRCNRSRSEHRGKTRV
jgi:hypothetical protein